MGQQQIVLAEDHGAVAEQLTKLLGEEFTVRVVADGVALLEAIAEQRPDAVVTDIAMPRMSGLIAAQRALERYPDLPIVFVTVADQPELIRRARALGALGYVLKCDAGEELLAAVHAGLAGHAYVSVHAREAPDGSRKGVT